MLFTLNIINYNRAIAKKYDNSITTIFLGDSHIEFAFNDTLLKNSMNLAKRAESFYFTYYKLKIILKSNPSIKKVYLGFSYHSISSYYDMFIDGDLSDATSCRYFFMLPLKEKANLLFTKRNNLFPYVKALIRKGVSNIWSKKGDYEGGYKNTSSSVTANLKSMEKRATFQYFSNGHLNDFSTRNIEYLMKIKDLCIENNINLILINPPVHSYYKGKVPKKFLDKFNLLSHNLKLETLDLSDLILDDDCFLPDGDHLSKKGAFQTTKYFEQVMLNKNSNEQRQ